MIARVWGGIISAARFCDRCGEIFFAAAVAGGVVLWLAGSIHSGRWLTWDELAALSQGLLGWITKKGGR